MSIFYFKELLKLIDWALRILNSSFLFEYSSPAFLNEYFILYSPFFIWFKSSSILVENSVAIGFSDLIKSVIF